jgi:hypothetical protein
MTGTEPLTTPAGRSGMLIVAAWRARDVHGIAGAGIAGSLAIND